MLWAHREKQQGVRSDMVNANTIEADISAINEGSAIQIRAQGMLRGKGRNGMLADECLA
jgi:hypothetical protein